MSEMPSEPERWAMQTKKRTFYEESWEESCMVKVDYIDHTQRNFITSHDYDALRAHAESLQAQRDKAIAFLHVYRNDTPLGHQPHMLAHEVDQFLKEGGK